MVTYVRLLWSGQTRAEEVNQRTGATGYVEASIGRRNEIYVLRQIFSPKYWKSGPPLPYDFVGNEDHTMQLIRLYLKSVKEGSMLTSGKEEWERRYDRLLGRIETDAEFKDFSFSTHSGTSDEGFARQWANGLWAFIQLGKRLQIRGLRPMVETSY
jgi:uncharacterized protein YukJ